MEQASQASYISGMGLFHNFYSDELDELTVSWVALQLEETIDILLKEKNHLILEYVKLREDEVNKSHKCQYKTAEKISKLLYEDDIIGDFLVIDYPIELKSRIGRMDMNLLFKIRQDQTNDKLKKEETSRQKMLEQN